MLHCGEESTEGKLLALFLVSVNSLYCERIWERKIAKINVQKSYYYCEGSSLIKDTMQKYTWVISMPYKVALFCTDTE